jgi:hypothetical protein
LDTGFMVNGGHGRPKHGQKGHGAFFFPNTVKGSAGIFFPSTFFPFVTFSVHVLETWRMGIAKYPNTGSNMSVKPFAMGIVM